MVSPAFQAIIIYRNLFAATSLKLNYALCESSTLLSVLNLLLGSPQVCIKRERNKYTNIKMAFCTTVHIIELLIH